MTCCPARSNCTARQRPFTSGRWTRSLNQTAVSPLCRPSRWRHPKKTVAATSLSPLRQAVPRASCRLWSMGYLKYGSSTGRRFVTVCSPRRRSAISASTTQTLSAAEGGCQAEIGVASAMAAALVATAYDAPSLVVENAAESALEHHLGMTCDPVAGYVQVPCIERCAFGAVKAWTAYAIASNEIASRHRVNFDATVMALAETAKEMNSKYKETSEAGLALS